MVVSTLGNKKRWKDLSSKMFLLNECNNLLAAYEQEHDLTGLRLVFSLAQKSSQLKGVSRLQVWNEFWRRRITVPLTLFFSSLLHLLVVVRNTMKIES